MPNYCYFEMNVRGTRAEVNLFEEFMNRDYTNPANGMQWRHFWRVFEFIPAVGVNSDAIVERVPGAYITKVFTGYCA